MSFIPASPKPPPQGIAPNPKAFGMSSERVINAIDCDVSIVAFIATLFGSCSPSAVFRSIWAVIVNALSLVLVRWSRSHIVKELFTRLTPFVANKYAASSVLWIILVFRIVTTTYHVGVNLIFAGVTFAVRVVRAAATIRDALMEIMTRHATFGSAIATAQPVSTAVRKLAMPFVKVKHGPHAVSFTDKVNQFSVMFRQHSGVSIPH